MGSWIGQTIRRRAERKPRQRRANSVVNYSTRLGIEAVDPPPKRMTARFSARTRAGPSSTVHPSASAGPYVTAPHSQRHLRCRPHEHAMLPTSIRPGRSG